MNQAPIFYDPRNALSSDWRTYFCDNRDTMFLLPCIEGNVEIRGAWMLLNIMLTMPLIKRAHAISRDKHLMLEGIYDSTAHAKIETEVSRTLEAHGYTRDQLGEDIIATANDALNMCYTHLGAYIGTMDIFAIADTILQPGVREICTMDYGDLTDKRIKRMETALKAQCEKVDALLSGDSLPINIFRAPLICGSLKKAQFFQFVLSAGPRTDTDDHVFLRPVVGSFLSGLKDVKDLAIESRSAAKSTHYNHTQMSRTQYDNRKLHIQNSSVMHLYPGDCGTSTYLMYDEITKGTAARFIGKWFLGPDNTLLELTKDRFDMVIGKPTLFRSVTVCLWQDGYCETCGGTITKSFSRKGNVGFLSNVNLGALVAQAVLSTKHLTSTNAVEYEIPYELQDWFFSSTNDIYLRRPYHTELGQVVLGFQLKDVARINGLKHYISDDEIPAGDFSSIKYMKAGYIREDGSIEERTKRPSMGGTTKTYPHLSPEILTVIRDHPEDIIIQGQVAWLKLEHIDPNAPIMQCTVVNNSILRFVERFSALVTKDVERYTSLNDFMRDLTRLVWPQVNTHATHVECLAKACLITSKRDFHIPVVTDPDKVMFGKLGRIIPMRSIGGWLAFERFNIGTNKPATYITPKRHTLYDEFMGYADTIERDMYWPEGTDKLREVPL